MIYLGPKDAMGVATTEVLHARNSRCDFNMAGTKTRSMCASETIFEMQHHEQDLAVTKKRPTKS